VYAYLKSHKLGHLAVITALIGSTALGSWVVYKYDLKAGILAEQNWYLFAYLLEKPWAHIGSLMIGIYFAQLYMRLLKYRKIESDVLKAQEFPIIHKACTSSWIRILMSLIGSAIVTTDLMIARSAIADPYLWTMSQNILYYGITRWSYVIGAMLIAFSIFFSPNTFVKEFLRRPFFLLGGNLCLLNALITPLVI